MINNKLSELLGRKRMKMSELQKLTGLSYSAVLELYHHKTKSVSFETMDKLCEALDCTICDLFEYVPGK